MNGWLESGVAKLAAFLSVIVTLVGCTFTVATRLDNVDDQAVANCHQVAGLTVSLRLLASNLVSDPDEQKLALEILRPLTCKGD